MPDCAVLLSLNLLSLISLRNNLSQKGELKEFLNDVLSVDFSGEDDVVFSNDRERSKQASDGRLNVHNSSARRIFLETSLVFLAFHVIFTNNECGIYLPSCRIPIYNVRDSFPNASQSANPMTIISLLR